jgi:hypothetical protein
MSGAHRTTVFPKPYGTIARPTGSGHCNLPQGEGPSELSEKVIREDCTTKVTSGT